MTDNYTTMIRRIGKTTYHVKVFCKDSGETMEDKIGSIIFVGVTNRAYKIKIKKSRAYLCQIR